MYPEIVHLSEQKRTSTMCKPLTYEELWGDPDAVQADDQVIEDILGEDEESDGGNFDDAHSCPECGEPRHLCICL